MIDQAPLPWHVSENGDVLDGQGKIILAHYNHPLSLRDIQNIVRALNIYDALTLELTHADKIIYALLKNMTLEQKLIAEKSLTNSDVPLISMIRHDERLCMLKKAKL